MDETLVSRLRPWAWTRIGMLCQLYGLDEFTGANLSVGLMRPVSAGCHQSLCQGSHLCVLVDCCYGAVLCWAGCSQVSGHLCRSQRVLGHSHPLLWFLRSFGWCGFVCWCHFLWRLYPGPVSLSVFGISGWWYLWPLISKNLLGDAVWDCLFISGFVTLGDGASVGCWSDDFFGEVFATGLGLSTGQFLSLFISLGLHVSF